jgi:hypothetical protein
MLLRYNKILRILAILLFSLELFAPALALGAPENSFSDECVIHFTTNQTQSIDLISNLVFEVTNSEEREGKEDCLISVCFVEVFNQLQKFQPLQITWSAPKDRFDIQPSLYTLHRVLLI